jgi:hypothetical protein
MGEKKEERLVIKRDTSSLSPLTIVLKWTVMVPTTLKNPLLAGCQWLTPMILATQEAEIRRIMV